MIKLLVVEDEQSIAEMYRFKFSNDGFTVFTAANGLEGLEASEKHRPDIILLDLRMPVMSGEEMLEKLRKTEWGADIRVVILTNISRDEAPHNLRFLNVDRYIVKAHHTPAQVLEIVKEILSI
jgi:CheY-like chemotaxis protein